MSRILSKEVLAPDVVRFWIEGAHIARKRKPGQFVIVRTSENGERIPLTIADVDKARGAMLDHRAGRRQVHSPAQCAP